MESENNDLQQNVEEFRESMNNLIYIIMDSCRYDSCEAARKPNMDRLGRVEKRYSFASWTSPSHYVYLMGMIPHQNPSRVFASEVYKNDFVKWAERLDVSKLEFKNFLPELSLPNLLKKLGYRTVAKVSMPLLNRFTTFSTYFDDYKLMENHNDFEGMLSEIEFASEYPTFYFLNLGETHYPYMLKEENMPHIHGLHGVLKRMSDTVTSEPKEERFFSLEQLKGFHEKQVGCVEYVDGLLGRLYRKCPPNTYVIITSDHGELFGEGEHFGHGPVFHEKVFEIPFVEGKVG